MGMFPTMGSNFNSYFGTVFGLFDRNLGPNMQCILVAFNFVPYSAPYSDYYLPIFQNVFCFYIQQNYLLKRNSKIWQTFLTT